MIYSSLSLIGLLCIPGYAFGAELIHSDHKVQDQYIITFKSNLDPEGRRLSKSNISNLALGIIQGEDNGIGAQHHGDLGQIYESVFPGVTAKLDEKGLENVLNSDMVESVEEDGYVQLDQVGSWGLDRIDDKDLPLDRSYNPTFGNDGEGVTAYIIDTGVLHTHNEFESRATQEYNSVGDGKNYDCHGHGTHVAGTVGAKTYGVANKAKLVGVKVLSCSGGGTWSGVIGGVNWVMANAKKPATANMSLGGGKNTSLNTAVKALVASGVSTVVAAGNSNRDACSYSPASEPDAITVGSTDNRDYRSSFSNYGQCVDIFAPGSSIKAPWIGSNTATRTISGTSMASPHVCGGAALYLGMNPDLTPTELVEKMLKDSIANTITNVGTGSPNKFLYVAAEQAPTTPTTSAPTRAPTSAPTTPNSSFGPTPSNYGTGEPTGGDGTKAPTQAPTPEVKCTDQKTKNQCKKLGSCVFGKKKIPGPCLFKKGKYKEDCGKFSEEDTCGGNCNWEDGKCVHRCDDLDMKACKKVKHPDDGKKMCKAKKVTNECGGCQPKSQCP